MEEFETFAKNLELNIEFIFIKYPYLSVVIGDFNAKLHKCYRNHKTADNWSKLEVMTSQYGLTH